MKDTTSPYIEVRNSVIHGRGVFAQCSIPEGTRVIEYVGEKITKAESYRRAEMVLARSKNDPSSGAVYIFELNKRYDIDGDVSYNTARYINHSCSPNCEVYILRGHIWICALRDIRQGEELSYNYGYDLDAYKDHPCRCGADSCIGFILAEEHWKRLRNRGQRAPVLQVA